MGLDSSKQEDSYDEGHARVWMEFFNVGFVLEQWNFIRFIDGMRMPKLRPWTIQVKTFPTCRLQLLLLINTNLDFF